MKDKEFTHMNTSGNPTLVDVSAKNATYRTAHAQATVHVGASIIQKIRDNELVTKKGSVFQTAILAGIMGAKRTADLIPLCHPLGLEDCRVEITVERDKLVINSYTAITSKTGVEMEALTSASIAALTIYDMCKALSHDIVIERIMLMEKTGGKRDFNRN